MKKGTTRKGNPCMKHYQGMKQIKKYAKRGEIRSAIFQSGAVYSRLLDDTSLTNSERNYLQNRFYQIEEYYGLR